MTLIATPKSSPVSVAGLALCAQLVAAPAGADVWLAPGDAHARSASQYLADQPGASGLTTEWPRWVQSGDGGEDAASFAAGMRAWLGGREQKAPVRIELRGGSDTPLVRGFADEPRAQGEIGGLVQTGNEARTRLDDLL